MDCFLESQSGIARASVFWRFFSAGFFGVMYMVMMNALVIVVAFLYNLFSETLNLGGLRMEIEESEGEES